MKKCIEKIKRIFSDYPKIFVCCLALLLFLVIFIVYRIADKYVNKSVLTYGSYYSYIAGEKIDFDTEILENRKGIISNVKTNINMALGPTPIYNDERIIFPNEMIVLFPTENYSLFKTLPYTYLDVNNDKIVMKDFNENIKNYIIYDGKYTYFFVNEVKFKASDKEYQLSKYSTMIKNGEYVEYFDYLTGEHEKFILSEVSPIDFGFTKLNLLEETIGEAGHLLANDSNYLTSLSKYGK